MRMQTELFPPETGFRPSEKHSTPRIWVRELRVYRLLAADPEHIVRSVKLRAGLNIIWARPSARSEGARLHTPGVSGHGTGKTTVCRFLRHLLGEKTFGTDEQRARLREAFPAGWIVGEVNVDGIPWVVARPIAIGPHPFVLRNQTLDHLFDDTAPRESLGDYLQAIETALVEPLKVASFATAPVPISWAHLIQWLARDQECRFAGLADFRHRSSDHNSPEMAVEDGHFLFRAVTNLIDTAEQAELEKNKGLLKVRAHAERMAPLHRFSAESGLKRWRREFPNFRQDLAGADFLQEIAHMHEELALSAQDELNRFVEPMELVNARKNLIEVQLKLADVNGRISHSQATMQWIEEQLANVRGEKTAEALAEFARKHFQSERYCNQLLTSAIEWECPLASGRLLPIETTREAGSAGNEKLLLGQKDHENRRLREMKSLLPQVQAEEQQAAKMLAQAQQAFDQQRAMFATQLAAAKSMTVDASRAAADFRKADTFEKSLHDVDRQIRESQEMQARLRQDHGAALTNFSDVFARICRAMLGSDVTGTIRFKGRQISPRFEQKIDLTSAALETLKILCFDIAALVLSIEGRGFHPRFLLHDGPREADMDVDLYHRLFLLILELEKAFAGAEPSFQYIITTTEPPHPLLKQPPYLREPVLSAERAETKFLGIDY